MLQYLRLTRVNRSKSHNFGYEEDEEERPHALRNDTVLMILIGFQIVFKILRGLHNVCCFFTTDEWEVGSIQSHRDTRKGRQFLVRWAGFSANDDTWEPLCNLGNAREAIDEYRRQQTDAVKLEINNKNTRRGRPTKNTTTKERITN